MMRIGISTDNSLWLELDECSENKVKTITSDATSGLRRSGLDYETPRCNFSIDHTDLIKALVAMRDGTLWKDKVRQCLRDKNYAGAIKEWRTNTGLGLKESKDAVDEFKYEEGL